MMVVTSTRQRTSHMTALSLPHPLNSLRTTGVCLLLVLIGGSCDMTSNETREAYRKVKVNLLSHPYAVEKIPPKVKGGEDINISISFSPQQILSVDEVAMTVTAAATITVGWQEPAFAWDTTNTSIHWVSVSAQDLWTPTIGNSLSVDSDDLIIELPPLLRIHHSGLIQTANMVTMRVSCAFDMEWFPFDEQRCSFPFMPFNADRANVNTVPSDGFEIATRVGDKSTADWTWEEVTPRQSVAGLDASNTFTFVSFEILMKRRSQTFYLTNIIFPVAAGAVLTELVFLIPAASGEKISFLIAIFISTTVFLSSLSGTMSKGQENICRFNVFILAITVQNILATAASIFVLHRYRQEQEDGDEMSSQSSETEGDNSLLSSDALASQLRHQLSVPNGDIDCTSKDVTTSSAPPSHPKLDAFERPITTHDNPVQTHTADKTCRVESKVTGIRRYWTRGYRLSSSELDWMFFVIFSVVSIIFLVCIMRAP